MTENLHIKKIYPKSPQHKTAEASCCCHSDSNDLSNTDDSAIPTQTEHSDITIISIHIKQMDCPTEKKMLEKQFSRLSFIKQCHFDLINRVLTVGYDKGNETYLETIVKNIQALGFDAEIQNSTQTKQQPVVEEKNTARWVKAITAIVFASISEILHWLHYPIWLVAIFAIIAIIVTGIETYKKGWLSLRHANININVLMSIAVTGAVILQEWPEAAMVMALFSIAELIEVKSLSHARHAIQGLMQLAPETATVKHDNGQWITVNLSEVQKGQHVQVKPGERIGLDGIIVSGVTTIDQAPITGESLPIEKQVGDTVSAGTINQMGLIEYQVTAIATHSTIARIIHAIEEAQQNKAPLQRFIDRFAEIYTPIVLVIAILVAIIPTLFFHASWYEWIYKALTLLIVACPCALVISTPITIVSGLTNAVRKGILVKGGVYLELARKMNWLALDKTGTITEGKPKQTDAIILLNQPEIACEALALSLTSLSTHPVSQAISEANNVHTPLSVNDYSALFGKGVTGVIDHERYYLVHYPFIKTLGLATPSLQDRVNALESEGKTVVVLANTQHVLALFAVADAIKESSQAAINALNGMQIKTLMLSGDNQYTAQAIAAKVGIAQAQGNLLPEDKQAQIKQLMANGNVVGMVGDGINDGPALAQANISFAMGAMGTDTAKEAATITLMDDDLRKIPRLVRLSQATHAILIQNITIALVIKLVFFVSTLFGLSSMWMAVFADVGTSLIVIANGLRMLKK